MTPNELSRMLAREQWQEVSDVPLALESLTALDHRILMILARFHPLWVPMPTRVLNEGALDTLADLGLIECDPLDAAQWRAHPKVVCHLDITSANPSTWQSSLDEWMDARTAEFA